MGFLAGALIVFVMIAVAANVLMRFFLSRPIGWTVEISEYALLFIAFLGAAWVLRDDGHVKVEFITELLPERSQLVLAALLSLVAAAACAVLTYYGVQVVWDAFQRGARSTTLLRFPQAPVLAVIPLGGALLALEFIRQARRSLRRLREPAR